MLHDSALYKSMTDTRGRPNFVFFLFFGARKRNFYFSAFYFLAKKDISIFVYFLFLGTKMAVKKTKKESQYFGWANAWRAELWVTCSRSQPLSTSPPAEHEYCEAVSTEQTQSAVSAATVGLC